MSEMKNTHVENGGPALSGMAELQGDVLVPQIPQKRSRSGLALFVTIILAAAVGAVIGLFSGSILKPLFAGLSGADFVWILLALLSILFLATLVHECGHLLGGACVGSRFLLLVVGPLEVRRSGGRIRIGLNTSLGLAGGLAASMPTSGKHLRRNMLVTTAGGPLASLLLTVVAGLILLSSFSAHHELLNLLLLLVVLISAALTIATLIPTRVGGFVSDGARLLMLLKGGEAVERWCAQVLLQLAIIEGQLPRDWSISLLKKASEQPDGSLEYAVGCSFAYYHALDSGEVQPAKQYLENMLLERANVPSLLWVGFALEAAYFVARYEHNAQQARVWFAQARGGIIDRCTLLRVEAAVLLAEGKRDEARQCINAGLAQVKQAMYLGTARLEEAWLRSMLQDLEEAGWAGAEGV